MTLTGVPSVRREPEREAASALLGAAPDFSPLALHESGHAVAAAAMFDPERIGRVSCIPIPGDSSGHVEFRRAPPTAATADLAATVHLMAAVIYVAGPLGVRRAGLEGDGISDVMSRSDQHEYDARIARALEIGGQPMARDVEVWDVVDVVAEQLLDATWPAVLAIAERVHVERFLTGAEFREYLAPFLPMVKAAGDVTIAKLLAFTKGWGT